MNFIKTSIIFILLASCHPSTPKEAEEVKKPAPKQTPSTQDSASESMTQATFGLEDLPEDLEPLSQLEGLIKRQGLGPLHEQGFHGQGLTIAIFDNGFVGLNHSSGQRLPPGLKVEAGAKAPMAQTSHGTKLAEIVYALATGQAQYDPKIAGPTLKLFNTNGFSNLVAAIDGAIAAKVDMILYAQVWEFGGNFDGQGFINREVSRATDAGILWVNAAGNMGLSTYTGAASLATDQSLQLARGLESLKLTVPQNQTPVRIVLAWNDFENSKLYQSTVDLDLTLSNSGGTRLAESRLIQGGDRESERPGFSSHAREMIETTLDAGDYQIRVNFADGTPTQDLLKNLKFRIMANGNGVRIPDATPDDSLPIPADHPQVLAVGAMDVPYSCRGLKGPDGSTTKPEIWVTSQVQFGSEIFHHGTSAASAIAVGTLAVLQSKLGEKLDAQAARSALNQQKWVDFGLYGKLDKFP